MDTTEIVMNHHKRNFPTQNSEPWLLDDAALETPILRAIQWRDDPKARPNRFATMPEIYDRVLLAWQADSATAIRRHRQEPGAPPREFWRRLVRIVLSMAGRGIVTVKQADYGHGVIGHVVEVNT